MKTSTTQFELMVTLMEQHGDLNKPSSNARGKISALRLWEELVTTLNSDGSGDHKTIEKWKKKERYIAPPPLRPPPPSPSPLESLRVLLNSPFEEVDVQDVPAPRQMLTPTQGQAQLQPALIGQTPPRRGGAGAGRPTRIRRSPRRLVRPAHTEQAAQHFLNSEEQWRKFKIEQHRDYMALRREQNRLGDMEVYTGAKGVAKLGLKSFGFDK